MSKVFADISTSLDGFVAGPSPTLEDPLGIGGERLHEWVVGLEAWRKRHGLEGGDTNAELGGGRGRDRAARGPSSWGGACSATARARGRTTRKPTAGGATTRPSTCRSSSLTHHAREPLAKEGGTTFTFVTDGIESAIEQARAAAGERDVQIAGGASAIQQALAAGLLDEIQINLAPVLLGGGTPLFAPGVDQSGFELDRVVDAPGVTHLRYRVVR